MLLAVVATSTPLIAAAHPSFSGRWVADLSTEKLPEHPDVYIVAKGHYECRSCSPPRSYPADGKPHAIPGDEDVQSESVTVLSSRSIRTRIVSPSLVRETTMTASADDRTAMYVSLDHRPRINGILRTRYLARRVAPAPPGANRVSGSWQGVAYLEVPKQVRTINLQLVGKRLSYRTPAGFSYSATVGGAPALVHGPFVGSITASIGRVDARTLVETRKRGGALLFERTYRLSRKGRALEISTKDASNGTTFTATYHRE
jgi:hypothetical protein